MGVYFCRNKFFCDDILEFKINFIHNIKADVSGFRVWND